MSRAQLGQQSTLYIRLNSTPSLRIRRVVPVRLDCSILDVLSKGNGRHPVQIHSTVPHSEPCDYCVALFSTCLGADVAVHADEETWYDKFIDVLVELAGVLTALAAIAGVFMYFGSSIWYCLLCLCGLEQETVPRGLARDANTRGGTGNSGNNAVASSVSRSLRADNAVGGFDNAVAASIGCSSVGGNDRTNNGQARGGDVCGNFQDSTDNIDSGNAASSTRNGGVGNVYNAFFAVIATLYQLFRLQAGRLIPLGSEGGNVRSTSTAPQQQVTEQTRTRDRAAV